MKFLRALSSSRSVNKQSQLKRSKNIWNNYRFLSHSASQTPRCVFARVITNSLAWIFFSCSVKLNIYFSIMFVVHFAPSSNGHRVFALLCLSTAPALEHDSRFISTNREERKSNNLMLDWRRSHPNHREIDLKISSILLRSLFGFLKIMETTPRWCRVLYKNSAWVMM